MRTLALALLVVVTCAWSTGLVAQGKKSSAAQEDTPEEKIRMARELVTTYDYDKGLDVLEGLIKSNTGTLVEARARTERAAIALKLPQYCFKVGDTCRYNQDVREGMQEYAYQRNIDLAVSDRNTARVLYRTCLEESGGTADQLGAERDIKEEAQRNNMDLAAAYQAMWTYSVYDDEVAFPGVYIPNLAEEYESLKSNRQKVLYLYAECEAIWGGGQGEGALAGTAAECRAAKAMFLALNPEMPPKEWTDKVTKDSEAWAKEHPEGPAFQWPFWSRPAELDPAEISLSVLKDFPKVKDIDRHEAMNVRFLSAAHRFSEAVDAGRKFLKQRAKSKYKGEVQLTLDMITGKSLSLWLNYASSPGVKAAGSMTTRNMDSVDVEFFKVDPAALLKSNWFRKEALQTISQILDVDPGKALIEELIKSNSKKIVKTFKVLEPKQYELVTTALEFELDEPGLYVFRATIGKEVHLGLHSCSDFILVTRNLPGKVTYYVAEGKGGAPLSDVEITVRETFQRQGLLLNYQDVQIHTIKTGADGLAEFKFTQDSRVWSQQASAFAVRNGTIAISEWDYPSYYYPNDSYVQQKAYVHTDRPVYRPGDTARMRVITRDWQNGAYLKPENPRQYRVQVSGPTGNIVLNRPLKSDMFGTFSTTFDLPKEMPLGIYYITAWEEMPDGTQGYLYLSTGLSFGVEEYKKPEYKVAVEPSTSQAMAGDKVSATIRATYYFGGPVTSAEVHYTVSRNPYYHYYVPPTEWDWLYGQSYYGQYGYYGYDQGYWGGGETLLDGEGETDASGEIKVELPVLEPSADPYASDYTYYVTATVTDLSRRTISGSGSVVVSQKPFYVHFDQKTSFYTSGDRPDVEVLAMTANNTAVPAKGTYTLFTKTYKYGEEKPVLTQVANGDVDLGKLGRGNVRLDLRDGGDYQLSVVLRDGAGRESKADLDVYVVDESSRTANLRFATLTLLSDKQIYEKGEKARFLLGTQAAGFVLLTAEGGGEILFQELRKVDTTGTELVLPIDDRHLPNFFVSAVMVHSMQAQFAERQVFVPPHEKLLNVVVEADKKEYQPGEKGKVTVTVTDKAGKPVEAQVGVWMFDSSVLYIQPETRGDIRQFFHGQVRYHGVSYKHSGYAYLPYRVITPAGEPKYQLEGLPYVPDYGGWGGYWGGGYGGGGLGDYSGAYGGARGNGWAERGAVSRAFDSRTLLEADGEMANAMLPAQAPAATTAADSIGMFKAAEDIPMEGKSGGRGRGEGREIAAREYFPDTILWAPAVVTGKDGKGTAEVTFPDSVTTWSLAGVGIDGGDRVGQASSTVLSTKRLIARIETPRFLVKGDTATLAAVVRSDLDEEVDVELSLSLSGTGLALTGKDEASITLKPGEEKRVDFPVRAGAPGQAKVKLTADSGDEADALAKSFPVVQYGADVTVTARAEVKGGSTGELTLTLPSDRARETTKVTFVANASIMGVLLSSLPYLLEYPYGCVEQTMSRFLPAVMVRQTLRDAGLALEGLPALPEKADLANPIASTGPWVKAGVFSDEGLDEVIRTGLDRLYGMQGYDGGWGWWGGLTSDTYMTAYVLSGLLEAQNFGVEVDPNVVDRATGFLAAYAGIAAASNAHVDMFVAYVLSRTGAEVPDRLLDNGIKDKETLSVYGRALLAMALNNVGRTKDAEEMIDHLAKMAWVDEKDGTASFRLPGASWWWWWEDRAETVAWVLRAFVTIRPDDEMTDKFARWLALNREGTHYQSTKTTAMAVMSLVHYSMMREEWKGDFTATIRMNGDEVKEWKVTEKDAMLFNGFFSLEGEALPDGDVKFSIEVDGKGTLIAQAFATYFSKEATIPAASSQISATRTYSKLVPKITKDKDAWGKEITVRDYDRIPVGDGDAVSSGDLVEVRVEIDSPNDYEYLVFEDPKPAGFEPVDVTSGPVYENGVGWYREYRDRMVSSFLSTLTQGKQVLTYQLRAEIPGTFHALPHRGYAMYAPRVRATSSSVVLGIK